MYEEVMFVIISFFFIPKNKLVKSWVITFSEISILLEKSVFNVS